MFSIISIFFKSSLDHRKPGCAHCNDVTLHYGVAVSQNRESISEGYIDCIVCDVFIWRELKQQLSDSAAHLRVDRLASGSLCWTHVELSGSLLCSSCCPVSCISKRGLQNLAFFALFERENTSNFI